MNKGYLNKTNQCQKPNYIPDVSVVCFQVAPVVLPMTTVTTVTATATTTPLSPTQIMR